MAASSSHGVSTRQLRARGVTVFKVLAGHDSTAAAYNDACCSSPATGAQDWRGLYTQFELEHVLGTIPYRWERDEVTTARLVAVTFEELDIVVIDGPLMHDGAVSGDAKAAAIKEVLGIEANAPLMPVLAERHQVALVRETEDEWECVIPHSLLPLLAFRERGVAVFERHPAMPITRRWRGDDGAGDGEAGGAGMTGWQPWYDESSFDRALLPDLDMSWLTEPPTEPASDDPPPSCCPKQAAAAAALQWIAIHDLHNLTPDGHGIHGDATSTGASVEGRAGADGDATRHEPPPPSSFDTAVAQAAALLEAQWPRSSSAPGGGVSGRIQLIRRSKEALPAHFAVLSSAPANVGSVSCPASNGGCNDAGSDDSIVCASALRDGQAVVVGHCMLRQACEVADGRSAILLSVVVDPSCRRQGIGRFIVAQAEEEARRRGFAFLYLSTPDQQRFYERCGFSVTEKISTVGTASNLLDQGALTGLQALLAKKASKMSEGASEEVAGDDHVWLRKALRETNVPVPCKAEDDLAALVDAADDIELAQWSTSKNESASGGIAGGSGGGSGGGAGAIRGRPEGWVGHVIPMLWERQVGPSCGLCALRMVRRFLKNAADGGLAAIEPTTTGHGSGGIEPVEACSVHRIAWVAKGAVEPREQPGSNGPNEVIELSPNRTLGEDASLLSEVKERGLSNEGEMFSAIDLAQLAADATGHPFTVLPLDPSRMAQYVMQGLPLIVAYDRDRKTSTPCLSEGRSAHWGVVRGFAVQSHDAHLQFVRQKDAAEGEEPGEDVKQSREFQYDSSKMVLLVSHGVSARPFACSYEELRASNVQLDDWVPTGEDVVRFVLPTREMQDMGSDGGGGGFRSQLAGTFIAPALPCPAAVGSWRPFDLFPV